MIKVKYYAMQVQLGWITLEEVPKKYRKKVEAFLQEAEENKAETEKSKGE